MPTFLHHQTNELQLTGELKPYNPQAEKQIVRSLSVQLKVEILLTSPATDSLIVPNLFITARLLFLFIF